MNLNSFGATISADFAPIFNPITHADRANIAKNGYISSKRRERYIQPIDRVIRAAAPPSETRAKAIDDTSNPKEIFKVLRDRRPLENKIMLLIGSAGSGKTTFVDYLQETALPSDIRAKTLWIRINGNNINISREEIYNSLRSEIISVCKALNSRIDFDDLETLKLVHSVEVNAYRKGIGRLFEKDQSAYDARLADVLIANESNLHVKATNYVRYLSNGGEKLVVYVLDNSDKRLKDDQLMMFEAAQWLQKEFRGLVVLPLREETYDNHRSEPPLDTALKDLVFRIEPPLFQKVLQSRVQLALKSIQGKGQKVLRYSLPNGMHVEYAASDQAFYLASIMKSIFEHDHHVRHLIVGLSGRNIRRALEIFLDFCTSGHIGEDEFLKIKQSEGQYVLPLSLVTTILLRVNQRFYSSSHAYLKNICAVNERDDRPHYFARLMILKFLQVEKSSTGPERLKGYLAVHQLRAKVSMYGVTNGTFRDDLESLVKGFCIVTEDFKVECIEDEDLVAISSAGLIHLEMLSDPYYLAAVSEDTWFDVKQDAELIAERIRDINQHYKPSTTLYNAQSMATLLRKQYNKEHTAISAVSDRNDFSEIIGMSIIEEKIHKFEKSLKSGPWLGVNARFPHASVHVGKVLSRTKYGVFVQMEQGVTGLIRADHLPENYRSSKQFLNGLAVSVKIERTDLVAEKMELSLTRF